ncbi:Uncharacterized protein dnl_26160 [Desulfonema limicola]|uniref:Uncharacterized protein n=1 Tax=Desulfonema limicola TaxID=45656 RepID=A0A975B7J7_9BACT|nr:Uncharacterized protein dnl_26160 [Desulfonema limicola]
MTYVNFFSEPGFSGLKDFQDLITGASLSFFKLYIAFKIWLGQKFWLMQIFFLNHDFQD